MIPKPKPNVYPLCYLRWNLFWSFKTYLLMHCKIYRFATKMYVTINIQSYLPGFFFLLLLVEFHAIISIISFQFVILSSTILHISINISSFVCDKPGFPWNTSSLMGNSSRAKYNINLQVTVLYTRPD